MRYLHKIYDVSAKWGGESVLGLMEHINKMYRQNVRRVYWIHHNDLDTIEVVHFSCY